MRKQLIAICLSVFMTASMLPISALAEQPAGEENTITEAYADVTPDDIPSDTSIDTIPSDTSITDISTDVAATDISTDVAATDIPSDTADTDISSDASSESLISDTSYDELTAELAPTEYVSDVDIPDSDELLEEYLYKDISNDNGVAMASVGDSGVLSGQNLTVYNLLKEDCAKVASGETESTIFTIPVTDLGISTSYTASELGVSSIVTDNAIDSDAKTAIYNLLDYKINKIMDCLLADCPYELYWYDKTTGVINGSPGISATYSGEWLLGFKDDIKIYMAVSENYIPEGAVKQTVSNYEWYLTVDTAKTQSVQTAITNAKNIVDENKSLADYDKLESYRQKICDLVTYNYSAANDSSTPYGDPWQLIYVFDGDTDTNVVCEGYAKSFKYLCDLSSFNSRNIACYLVSGTSIYGNSSGPHMWNIVTMNDRKNYIVDVTNCDTGSVGADDKLFIVSATGSVSSGYSVQLDSNSMNYVYDNNTLSLYDSNFLTVSDTAYSSVETAHEYVEQSRQEVTCGKAGSITYVCSNCGDSYTEDIAATGKHNYKASTTKEATCAEKGITTYTCAVCGDSYTEDIPVIGHSPAEAVKEKIVEATCKQSGSYDSVVYCSVCGTEISRETITVEATGNHTPAEAAKENEKKATCGEAGSYESVIYCSVCKLELSRVTITVEATGKHDYKASTTKEASCAEKGITKYTCAVCGDSYTEDIPVIGHSPAEAVKENVVEATCKQSGSYDSVVYCSVCKEEISRETITVEATGKHDYKASTTKEATCAEKGITTYTCAVCGDSYTEDIPVIGHSPAEAVKENIVEATCKQSGSYDSVVYCSVCKEEISRETIKVEATGKHDYKASTTKEATCTEKGITTYTCSVCGDSYTKDISMIDHTPAEAVKENVVEATCNENGSYDTVVYCSVCKKEISRQANTTKATGKHTYGTTSVTKKATTTSDGNLRSTCSVCKKETKNTVIPKISSIKLSATSYTYNGKAKTPTVTVKDSKGNTISSNYYKVTYTNNKLPGSATVKIAFKTCYSGTSTKTFKILPKGTKITAVSATKSKGFTVKWSAQKTYTSGYQVQYATNKSFTSAKTKTLNLSKNSLTVSSLKAKTTYYVRVRTYRTVNGQKYYSAWSTVSKVKTK